MVWYGSYDVIWHGKMCRGVVWRNMMWNNMVRHDFVWCDRLEEHGLNLRNSNKFIND